MKMIMVSYNSAIDSEVIEIVKKCDIENYTKWTEVHGRGKASGSHFGSEIWPEENSVLLIGDEEEKIKRLLTSIRELREKLGKAGVKAFTWPLEEIT